MNPSIILSQKFIVSCKLLGISFEFMDDFLLLDLLIMHLICFKLIPIPQISRSLLFN